MLKFIDTKSPLVSVTETELSPTAVTIDVPAESDSILVSFNRVVNKAQVTKAVVAAPVHLSAATRLKKMIEETDELIVCPGVYDGLSARIALRVGFSALYMVSS